MADDEAMADDEEVGYITKERAARDKLEQLWAAYNHTFETESGRIVLEDLKIRCFYNDTTIARTLKDTLVNEGQRRMLLTILTFLQVNLKDVKEAIQQQGEVVDDYPMTEEERY